LPPSRIDQSSISAAFSRQIATARRITSARAECGWSAHSRWAAAARAVAAATSAALARPVVPMTAPVAGSMTGAVPPSASRQPPEKTLPCHSAASRKDIGDASFRTHDERKFSPRT
jgi:hypothetical protein